MADDVELFIFSPAQLASQKSEFFEEVYFRRRVCNGGLQFGFKHGGRVIVPVFLEFTVMNVILIKIRRKKGEIVPTCPNLHEIILGKCYTFLIFQICVVIKRLFTWTLTR